MPTKSGDNLINAVVPSGTGETTLGPYNIGDNISIGVDAEIVNGASPPTTPLVLSIEWQRYTGGRWVTHSFQGSIIANGDVPIKNYKIPFDAHAWRIKYIGGNADVTLKVDYGVYAP